LRKRAWRWPMAFMPTATGLRPSAEGHDQHFLQWWIDTCWCFSCKGVLCTCLFLVQISVPLIIKRNFICIVFSKIFLTYLNCLCPFHSPYWICYLLCTVSCNPFRLCSDRSWSSRWHFRPYIWSMLCHKMI
jgi:hypothetical protein